MIASLNQHLKFDIKGHLSTHSSCVSHCTTFSLSDPKCETFRSKCDHEHASGCEECEIVDKTLCEVAREFDECTIKECIPKDTMEEIDFEINQSKLNILSWKAHCVRTVHQDQAKKNVLEDLQPNQALVVMDWAMKFLPIKHRESQSDFFGKKGISWHLSSVITRAAYPAIDQENHLAVNTFVHILQLGNQGWFSVAHIITDLLNQMPSFAPNVSEIILKSDNAGCYHCSSLVSYLQHLNQLSRIKILEYNFSEPQSGKDICDAKTAHCKMHILRFSGEGHDVLTPDDMVIALNSNGGVKGVVTSVVSIDQSQEMRMKTKIPNISLMNNISFHPDGVTFRKAYGIGRGYFLPSSHFKDNEQILGFEVHTQFHRTDSYIPGSVKHEQDKTEADEEINKEEEIDGTKSGLFACPEQGCMKVYRKQCLLECHICVGNHLYCNTENTLDKVKHLWAEKCIAVEKNFKVLVKGTLGVAENIPEGWALKTAKAQKRFSAKVKEFLYSMYLDFERTGRRPNFDKISANLKYLRNDNGLKHFNREEWLSSSQIKSLLIL
ncbi:uncharacterized protein LOC134261618 [Saccostrea cucullata]|uniref:uncharacterized protein LOC134261618 n=1 Tax=Saccostrea cuccullata TaxID=36930 RepID=UPI002ECFE9F9